MIFVLDASVTMAFVFQDEATARTDAILDRLGEDAEAITPALWRWEVGNELLVAERRGRLTTSDSHRHLTCLQMLPIETDEHSPREAWAASLLVARAHKLTLYDAAYLELAIRRGAPLATLDKQLRRAAKAEGLQVLPERLR